MEDERIVNKVKRSSSMSMSKSFRLRSPSLNKLRLRKVFDMFDKNGDGVITTDEISQALLMLGLEADPSELGSIIASFVRPGSAGLVFDDFEAFHQSLDHALFEIQEDEELQQDYTDTIDDKHQQKKQQEEELLDSDLTEAFKVFDEDGDGFISAKELQAVLSKLGLPEAQQELTRIQLMISSFDHNHDGFVDFVEFKQMMLHSVLVIPASS